MHPSQVMPSTASVAVAGLDGCSASREPLQAAISGIPIRTNTARRAIRIIVVTNIMKSGSVFNRPRGARIRLKGGGTLCVSLGRAFNEGQLEGPRTVFAGVGLAFQDAVAAWQLYQAARSGGS